MTLISVATTTTLITLLLQDNALSADLQRAANTRLERAASLASKLLDEHLAAQLKRFRAIAATPQFHANLEAGHKPTLTHFATELEAQHTTTAILFLDRKGKEIAGSGNRQLRAAAARLLGNDNETGTLDAELPGSSVVSDEGVAHSVAVVPLLDGTRHTGNLVAFEEIGLDETTSWSNLCGATVTIGRGQPASDELWLNVRPLDQVPLQVAISFEAERTALANSRWNLIFAGLIGLALASAASVFLSRSLVRPIRLIQSATEEIAEGKLDIRVDATRGDEVGDVARALNLMLDRLSQNISHRIRVENEISHLAYHDSLTGLGNRRLLQERLVTALEECSNRDTGVAVIFLDLDRFKDINDTLGHTAGDELLLEVARRLNSCVAIGTSNASRSGDGDEVASGREAALLARLGGDEFTILLTDIDDRAEIEGVADRIIEALADPYVLRGQEVSLSASLGIAMSPDDASDVETLLRDSDMAMFHAKNSGGRGYEFYTDSMEAIAARRLDLENSVARALQNDEFELYYQPKIDLETNQIAGVEALLRWPKGQGSIGPDEFIPVAEETGAIVPIGEWALRTAMQQAVEWRDQGLTVPRVAVNVSVRQLEHRVDFVSVVAGLLEETGLDPQLIELEITERALARDMDSAIELLERLKDLGVGLSLDDFGTGYSSLSFLRHLPIDTLKVDRSFVTGADSCADDAAMLGSIIAMAKTLGLRVVAEGVETRKHRNLLTKLGCNEIQGFLISRPVDAEETTLLLRKKRNPSRRKASAKTNE